MFVNLFACFHLYVFVFEMFYSINFQLLEFFGREIQKGKSVWADVLMNKQRGPISVETEGSNYFKCLYFSAYICIGQKYYTKSEGISGFKRAKVV